MAEKNIIERTYNIPLRKEWLKVPKYKRSKKAVKALREFLVKHMKSENIKLGMRLNEHIWQDGIRSPPHHVKVHVTKDESDLVKAELEGFEFKEAVKAKKKEEKSTGLKGKLQNVLGKKEEQAEETTSKTEDVVEETKTETKPKKKPAVKPKAEKKPAAKPKTKKKPTAKKTETKPKVKKQ